VAKTFIEAIAAPGFSAEAQQILAAKKNLRLLEVRAAADAYVVKSINGGFLVQTTDGARLDRAAAKVVTERQPTEDEWRNLEFAWKCVKHVKSNAIVYARDGQLLAAGAGQMSRVFSVEIGAMKSVLPLNECVLASDAFFPFPDGLEGAAKHGITAAIQPGGSVKDQDVIDAANRLGIAMIFTGVRHFRH
jgi:phosphoribosylaminoimidazolecarboxamide formyltransferase/IMP cyclohydrolase